MSKTSIKLGMVRSETRFQACYNRQLSLHPELEGTVRVRFLVTKTGSVVWAKVAFSTLGNGIVEQCVVETVRRIDLPPLGGSGSVMAIYPLKFTRSPSPPEGDEE